MSSVRIVLAYALRPIRKYAVFRGRANRPEFWWFFLFLLVCQLALGVLDRQIGFWDEGEGIGLTSSLFTVVMFIPHLAVTFRRFHDVGVSGVWALSPILFALAAGLMVVAGNTPGIMLCAFLTIISTLGVFGVCVWPSRSGKNKWGPSPREVCA